MQTVLERKAELEVEMMLAIRELNMAENQLSEAEPEYLDAAGLKYLGARNRVDAVKRQLANLSGEPEPKMVLSFGIAGGGGDSDDGGDEPVGILFLRSEKKNRKGVYGRRNQTGS